MAKEKQTLTPADVGTVELRDDGSTVRTDGKILRPAFEHPIPAEGETCYLRYKPEGTEKDPNPGLVTVLATVIGVADADPETLDLAVGHPKAAGYFELEGVPRKRQGIPEPAWRPQGKKN